MKSLIFLIVLFVFSCRNNSLPEGILPAEKMRAIYWDLMRADEMTNYYKAIDTSFVRLKKQEALYQAVFRIHKISREEFNKSKAYYEMRPEMLRAVLDSIRKKAERDQSTDSAVLKKPDSIPRPVPVITPDSSIKQKKAKPDSIRKKKGLILEKAN